MISAKEAYDKASEIKRKNLFSELSHISNLLNIEVKDGHYELTVSTLSREARREIESLGYVIEEIKSGMNEYEVKISWYNVKG